MDRVGGFRCERRGIIDLPVSSFENIEKHSQIWDIDITLKILENIENIDITLEELRNIENIDKTLKILRKKAWKHWQNIAKYWQNIENIKNFIVLPYE